MLDLPGSIQPSLLKVWGGNPSRALIVATNYACIHKQRQAVFSSINVKSPFTIGLIFWLFETV